MDQACVHLAQAGLFAVGQPDGMAVKPAFAQKAVGLVGVKVIAGGGEQRFDPSDLVRLFREVGLHQAIGVFGPERAEGVELLGR